MRLLISLWASDSAHLFAARMSALTVELQWTILPHTVSAATEVRANTPPRSSQRCYPQGTSLCQGPLSAGTIWPLQVRWKAPQWALHFAVEVEEDACVGRHMAGHLLTFACFCGCQRGGGSGSESWASEECQVRRLEGQPSLCPFAMETSGVLGQAALSLVWDIGQCLN